MAMTVWTRPVMSAVRAGSVKAHADAHGKMGKVMIAMNEFTDEQINILDDMLDYWADMDRHGELRNEWNYDDEMIDAFSLLYAEVKRQMRKRRFGK